MSGFATAHEPPQVSVLFCCLGNICRSPMAEAVFRHKLSTQSQSSAAAVARVDSCGTGAYHAGAEPDPRTMTTLKRNNITSYVHAARKIQISDFQDFDLILGMDAENLEDLEEMRESIALKKGSDSGLAKVQLFGAYGGRDPEEEVVDPYYGNHNGFDIAYEQMDRFSNGLISEIEQKGPGSS